VGRPDADWCKTRTGFFSALPNRNVGVGCPRNWLGDVTSRECTVLELQAFFCGGTLVFSSKKNKSDENDESVEMSDQRAKPLKERVAEIGKQVLGQVSKFHSVLTNEFSDTLQRKEHSLGRC
jgi:nitric oxide reductase large subunit